MRKLLFFLTLVIARCGSGGGDLAFAQSCPTGYTRIADTLYGPVAPSTGKPTLFFGDVVIGANSAGVGANGASFGRIPLSLPIANGTLSVCLIPNDTAVPANTSYAIRYAYRGDQGATAPWNETWSVPTSGAGVNLSQIRITAALPPAGWLRTAPTGIQWYGPVNFTNALAVSIPASQHGLSNAVVVVCNNGVAECGSVNVDALGNVTVGNSVPATGSVWIAGGPAYVATFTSESSISIPSTSLQAAIAFAACYDASGNQLGAGQLLTSSAFDNGIAGLQGANYSLALGSPPQTGKCVFLEGAAGVAAATGSSAGYLSAADWTTFNAKQTALGFTPLNPANNLSDVASASTARNNLGLGTSATHATSAFEVPLTFGAELNRSANTITIPAGGITNAMLANSTVTVNTAGPITGAAAPALGGSITIACVTCGVITNPLSQFAATTSAQLAGVLTDKTGTGAAVFASGPALTSPILYNTPSNILNTGSSLWDLTGSTMSFLTGATGTGTQITTQNFGEMSSATSLTAINFVYGGVIKHTMTPTYFLSPSFKASTFGSGIVHSSAVGLFSSSAVSLTADVSGTLPLNGGGTNGTDPASNGGIIYSNASQYKVLAGTPTANRRLCSGASSAPSWCGSRDVQIIPFAAAPAGTAVASGRVSYASGQWTPTLRAGTYNLGATLNAIPNTGATLQFVVELPLDWDTSPSGAYPGSPYINIFYGSGSVLYSPGFAQWTVSSACIKADGTTSDDPSFQAETAFAAQNIENFNPPRLWSVGGQITKVASGGFGCAPGSMLIVKLALSGTATWAINAYQAVLTIPTLPVAAEIN